MKKLLTLVLMTSGISLLNADYPSSNGGTTYYQQNPQPKQTPQQGQGTGYSSYESSQTRTTTQGRAYQGSSYQNGSTQDLTTRIQNALKDSKYSNVTVTVTNGTVTLQGTVNSEEEKVALGALVGGVDGVQTVNNQVTVAGSGTSTYQGQNYQNQSHYGSRYRGSADVQQKIPSPPQPNY